MGIFLLERDLFGKPVPAFPDHALKSVGQSGLSVLRRTAFELAEHASAIPLYETFIHRLIVAPHFGQR
jgi:hypothetical protein